MVLTPAYGRDYKSKKSLLEDFEANKDFVANIMGRSAYINKSQVVHEGLTSIQFRYSKNRKTFVHKVGA